MVYSPQNIESLSHQEITPGMIVQEKIDGAVHNGFRSLRDHLIAAAGTGFGKGVLVAAGLILGALALSFGFQAAAAGGAFSEGMAIGVNNAVVTLFDGVGVVLMGMGGLAGAVVSTMARQNELNADNARKSKEFAKLHKEMADMRSQLEQLRSPAAAAPQQPQPEPVKAAPQPAPHAPPGDAFAAKAVEDLPEISYTQREINRRNRGEQGRTI